MEMRVTVENWKDAERHIKQSGIRDTVYDDNGFLQTLITQDGIIYEFSTDVLTGLVASGLIEVKLGRKR
jgi:hypothetical protein